MDLYIGGELETQKLKSNNELKDNPFKSSSAKFRIAEILGSGTFGDVFNVNHEQSDKQ